VSYPLSLITTGIHRETRVQGPTPLGEPVLGFEASRATAASSSPCWFSVYLGAVVSDTSGRPHASVTRHNLYKYFTNRKRAENDGRDGEPRQAYRSERIGGSVVIHGPLELSVESLFGAK
jgi:hypothetical protein